MSSVPRQSASVFRFGGIRFGAAWVVLFALLGVGHVVPALHFLFVAHRLCAEHGELVDASGESAEAPRAASLDATSAPASVCAAGDTAHEHEHCLVVALARVLGAAAEARGFACILPAQGLARVAGEARAAHLHIELLLYAPKLAPPPGGVLPGLPAQRLS